jgi:hypothetical protein
VVYAARRWAWWEAGEPATYLGRLHTASSVEMDEAADEHQVLAQAVRARVVGLAEAQLIARTRLHGESMQRLARERGVSCRQLYRHRAAAEERLAAHLNPHRSHRPQR